MYDYRQDVIDLMRKTQATDESLSQSAVALNLIVNLFKNSIKDLHPDQTNETSALKTVVSEKTTTDSELDKQIQIPKQDPSIKFIKKNHDFDNLKDNEFRVVRKMNGAVAVDSSNTDVAYFSESVVRSQDLQNYDIVELARAVPGQFNESAYITNVIPDYQPDDLVEFSHGIVERTMFGLAIQKSIDGTQLTSRNSAVSLYKIAQDTANSFDIKPGDTATLVWHENNPAVVKIRWVNHANEKVAASTHRKTVSKNAPYKPVIDFDLNGQTAALIAADDSVTSNLAKVVESHNGQAEIVELTHNSNPKKIASQYDIAILMQSYIKHSVSQGVIDALKNGNCKVAMSQSASQFSLEKALYRAENGLNIADNDTIEYPYK